MAPEVVIKLNHSSYDLVCRMVCCVLMATDLDVYVIKGRVEAIDLIHMVAMLVFWGSKPSRIFGETMTTLCIAFSSAFHFPSSQA